MMQYLKAKLKEQAARRAQGQPISSDNYQNKRLHFKKYADLLFEQPGMRWPSPEGIKSLHDVTLQCLIMFGNIIGPDVLTWDPLIVFMLLQKLDAKTRMEYLRQKKNPKEVDDLEEFMDFLDRKIFINESMKILRKGRTANSFDATKKTCPLCEKDHALLRCWRFLKLSCEDRMETVEQHDLCINCLYSHGDHGCKSAKLCKVIQQRHHTLLHDALC